MTTHELARKLLAGEDVMATVSGYEGGVNEIGTVSDPSPILLNVNTAWYYGDHEYWFDRGNDKYPTELAIHIGR